jgi:ABC-2 type transport system permease protein
VTDFTTVMWKEWHELRAQGDDLGRGVILAIIVVLLVVVAGVAAVAGAEFVRSPILLLACALPASIVMGNVCDAFAGERERHTLETLLASRLSNEVLLAGKIAVNVLYAWGASLLLFGLCVLGANLPALGRTVTFPTLSSAVTILAMVPLGLVFLCGVGVLVSLRSATARQAGSRLVVLFLGLFFLLVAGPAAVIRILMPEVTVEAQRIAEAPNFAIISVAVIGATLLIADVVVLLCAWLLFQRERMIEVR